ncbi:hypothetical protein TFLX_01438 [Thermoflexales bacterium]|nr:hypothetical protein TFLX_01438 [Thermoflexales bacterium]
MAYSPTAQQPRFNYGGQAVIEGVMMRGSKALAVAVRDPKGQIVIHTEPINAALYNGRLSRTPFLRGLAMLWDSLGLGMRALMYSANVATGEVGVEFKGPIAWGTTAIALIIALLVFLLLPRGLSSLIEPTFGPLVSAFLEGFIRLALFVGYIWLIGKMEDIRRVFGYHGAEHKTINAYEAGLDLSIANVQQQTVQHPRCGTAFLLTVVVLSIFVFAPLNLLPYGWGLVLRIALLPVLAMIGYEFIRFSARHLDNQVMRAIIVPNLALQKLTTREPDDAMVQVAIEALKKVLDAEQNRPLNPEYLIP